MQPSKDNSPSSSRAPATSLRQDHACVRCPDVDHVQRRRLPAALESAAQGLAVDRHDAAEVELVGFGEGGHELPECRCERLRVEQPEHPAERIVAGNPMLEHQDLPEELFLGETELGHVRRGLRPAQQRGKGDEQNIRQLVLRVVGSRIRQPSENLLEFPHDATPPVPRESSSESISLASAIPLLNAYAIPLPSRGGWERNIPLRTSETTADRPD